MGLSTAEESSRKHCWKHCWCEADPSNDPEPNNKPRPNNKRVDQPETGVAYLEGVRGQGY